MENQNTTQNKKRWFLNKPVTILFVVLSLLLCFVSVILIFFGAYGMESGKAPNLFGYSIYAANGMSEDVPEGYAIFAKRETEKIGQGQALVYYDNTYTGQNKIFVQYVYEKTEDGYETCTKNGENAILVNQENVLGKAEVLIPCLGAVLSFAMSKIGMFVFIGSALIFLFIAILLVANNQNRKKSEFFIDPSFAEEENEQEDAMMQETPILPEPQEEAAYDEEEETAVQEEERPGLRYKTITSPKLKGIGGGKYRFDFTGEALEIERLSRVVKTATKQKGIESVQIETKYGIESWMHITCEEKDLSFMAVLLRAVKEKTSGKAE